MNGILPFDGPPPAARNTDPDPSHAAETHMNDSGARERGWETFAGAVKRYPDCTVREVCEKADLSPWSMSRRASDALQKGLIEVSGERTCAVTGRTARTYRVVRP